MKYITKVAIFLFYSLEILILLLCTYLTIALIGASLPINTDYNPENGEIEIFIISNGVHTDICLPVETTLINWTEFIDTKTFSGIHQNPQFISIGWGDKGFFLDTPSLERPQSFNSYQCGFSAQFNRHACDLFSQKTY